MVNKKSAKKKSAKSVKKSAFKKSTNSSSKKKSKLVEKLKDESNFHYEKRWCAALSYLFIGIIWYFLDERLKKDSFVKFHVKQGLVLLITLIMLRMLASLITFFFIIWLFVGIGLLVIGLIGIVYALENKKKYIPLIGKYSKNFTF
jgi:uncharacterized membrane protein